MDAVSVTAAEGFRAQGVSSGIKPGRELDLAVIAADGPVNAAAVFTTNQATAAPVIVSKAHLASGTGIAAIVANSGCANAATGAQGEAAARAMAAATAGTLDCAPGQVLVASTGPIGTQLPLDAVLAGIELATGDLGTGGGGGARAAAAILTTDSVAKEATVAAGGYKVGGMAKGSGMIRPDMATMLAFLTTDARVSAADLSAALGPAVDGSFHSLNIDGCASTNDTVAVLASGASGVSPSVGELALSFSEVCVRLSEMMAADAEGASRVVEINVRGAASDTAARVAGRAMADSVLVRASFFGGDPNWGRLIGAVGASGVHFDPLIFEVAYEGITVAQHGVAVAFDEAEVLDRMERGDLTIDVAIGDGNGIARVLTTDLTPDYVVFNGERS